MAAGNRPPLALCFAGSGCLAAYQLGVVRCLQRHGSPLLSRVTHVVGCSGGALVAAVLARAPAHTDLAIEHSLLCRNITGVEAVLTAAAAAATASKGGGADAPYWSSELPTLVVAAATAAAPRRLRLFSNWGCTTELLTCLRASCHIPTDFHPLDVVSPYASSYASFVEFRGYQLIDGGLAAASPTLCAASLIELDSDQRHNSSRQRLAMPPANVIISPFAGKFNDAHIAPSGPTSWKCISVADQKFFANAANARRGLVALAGGGPEEMQAFVGEGEADCERFLRETGQYKASGEGAPLIDATAPAPPELLRKPRGDYH